MQSPISSPNFWRWSFVAVIVLSIGAFLFLFRYDVRIYKGSKPVIYDRFTGTFSRANRQPAKVDTSRVIPNLFDAEPVQN